MKVRWTSDHELAAMRSRGARPHVNQYPRPGRLCTPEEWEAGIGHGDLWGPEARAQARREHEAMLEEQMDRARKGAE